MPKAFQIICERKNTSEGKLSEIKSINENLLKVLILEAPFTQFSQFEQSNYETTNLYTLVEPRLMLDVEAAEAAAGLSELSAWWRTLQRRVTEDMMVWRMDRMPDRASARCF